MTTTVSHNTVNNYWNIVKHLSQDAKIDLIMLLSQSLKSSDSDNIPASRYYGVWGDDGMTDEEFISEVKSLRNFNRDIVDL